jgi:hypothetical protein
MITNILLILLSLAVAILGVKLYLVHRRYGSRVLVTDSRDDQIVSATQVPRKLRELFTRSYGADRNTDKEISVCFRYAKFHKIFDSDTYPVDCKIMMHREAYLGDHTISTELGTLIIELQKCGLEFVAVFGEQAAATTREYDAYLMTPDAVQHGEWKPSKGLAEKFSTGLGRDSHGRFASK